MDRKLDILAFGAHPDDVELSAAGTLIKHISMGFSVGIIDLTMGEMGTRGTPTIRALEAEQAMKIIGAKFRENLNHIRLEKPVLDFESWLKVNFSDQLIRVFDPEPIRCVCPCSQERMLAALKTLSQEDIDDLIKEHGSIEIVCEYCLHEYQFSASELD